MPDVTPYKPGDRVVCPDPDGGLFVGTVRDHLNVSLRDDGADARAHLVVSDGARTVHVPASEVRPAMPRDRVDLERWGRWWYLDDEVVSVRPAYPDLAVVSPSGWWDGPVRPSIPWRGPVARPPEVRS